MLTVMRKLATGRAEREGLGEPTNVFCQGRRRRGVAVGQKQGELFASDPGGDGTLGRCHCENVGEFDERPVAASDGRGYR